MYKNKTFLTILAGLLIIFLILFLGFNYLFQPFYWACRNIPVGANKEVTQMRMLKYISNRSYTYQIKAGGDWKGKAYTEELQFSKNNAECSIYFSNQQVIGTERSF